MINTEISTENNPELVPNCQVILEESEQIEENEIDQPNTNTIEPLLDNPAVIESEEEYHSLSSVSSLQIEPITRTKEFSNLVKCGTFISKV